MKDKVAFWSVYLLQEASVRLALGFVAFFMMFSLLQHATEAFFV